MIKGNTSETGKITKWTEKEFLFGLIKENTSVSIKMIKNMDTERSNGNDLK